jgi:hypothetical protein
MTLAEAIVKCDVLELEVRDGENEFFDNIELTRDQFINLIPKNVKDRDGKTVLDYDIYSDELHDYFSIHTCTVSTWESCKDHLRLTLFTGRTNSIPK